MPWIHFKLIEKPYYDREGNILESIVGRRNQPGKDEFTGGGYVYPDLSKVKVTIRYEKTGDLMVLVDGELAGIEVPEPVTYIASPKLMVRDTGGFQQKVVDDLEVESLKYEIFGIKPIIEESGVTR